MTTDWKALCAELAETLAEEYGVQREFDSGDPLLGSGAIELLSRARIALSQPEPEGPPLEPRGCPTPGACSCPTSPTVPPELIRALELAEAALADIGDAEREFGDDLAWAEARAAQDLPRIRIALDRWGRLAQPKPEGLTDEEILNLSEEHCVSYTRLDGSVTYPYENDMNMKDDVLSFARALIAADRARWGRPATTTETP